MLKPVDRPRVSHSYHKKPWRASQRAKAVGKDYEKNKIEVRTNNEDLKKEWRKTDSIHNKVPCFRVHVSCYLT